MSDTDKITFQISTRTVRYGDGRNFIKYQIVMRQRGRVVGVEDGPSRQTAKRSDAHKAARARVRELKSHRLYVIRVTDRHIKDGAGRDCYNCAISLALRQNQKRMGLSEYDYGFEVSPYACFMEPRGLVLVPEWGGKERAIPADKLPDVVTPSRRSGFFSESMVYWAMHFDDWDDSRSMSLAEWREERGYDDDERPWKPSPCSFVLDLDAMRPATKAR